MNQPIRIQETPNPKNNNKPLPLPFLKKKFCSTLSSAEEKTQRERTKSPGAARRSQGHN